jgi:hypothetical protein
VVKVLEAATEVIARKSSWSSVTDTEELMGVLNSFDALPQYCGRQAYSLFKRAPSTNGQF